MVQVLSAALLRARNAVGKRGHHSESLLLLVSFVWLTLPAACLLGYLVNFQTYVLHLDVLLCALAFAVLGPETLLGLLYGIHLAKSKGQQITLLVGFVAFLVSVIIMVSLHATVSSPGFFGGH
mmetsp:Transcript_67563/g.156832  ORF Transcript_67563/g.156832 Transcript_67563/m.156832 type:complete len:123 (+) Transcript_67563:243-611(+)